jgi:hypothetical protein
VLIGVALGLIGGMYNLIRQSLLASRDAAGGQSVGSQNGSGQKTRDGDKQR